MLIDYVLTFDGCQGHEEGNDLRDETFGLPYGTFPDPLLGYKFCTHVDMRDM